MYALGNAKQGPPVSLGQLFGTEVEEEHTQEYEQEIDKLALEILLVENRRSEKKTDDDTAPPDHRHDGNHCSGQAQRVKIYKVGCTQENADKDN